MQISSKFWQANCFLAITGDALMHILGVCPLHTQNVGTKKPVPAAPTCAWASSHTS
jgi:hypothetical protein